MALRGKNEAAKAAPGGFEDESNDAAVAEAQTSAAPAATAEAAGEPVAAAAVTPEAKAGVAASVAVATAAASAVAVRDNGPIDVIGELKDKYPPVEFGAFEKLSGSNGQVMDSQKKLLGQKVKLEVLSWNYLTVISPGDDSAEAKETVRYSHDGVTINGTGQDVNDYLKHLRENEDYPKASKKKYIEVLGVLLEVGEGVKSDHVGQVVQVSLSPTAATKFVPGHQIQVSVKRRMGQISAEDAARVVIRAEVKTNTKNQTYTTLATASS